MCLSVLKGVVMFAIVQVGTTQFKVEEGAVINAMRLSDEQGSEITLEKVLMYSDGTDVRVGQPYLTDVKVSATIVKHELGRKTVSLKYRRRKNSAVKSGNREKLTTINITKIAA